MKRLVRYAAAVTVLGILAAGTTYAADVRYSDNEMRLVNKVRKELVMLPEYGVFDNIGFSVEGNKLILTGQASRPTLQNSAERVVKRIESIDEVENRIEVLPLSPADDELRARVYRQVYGHTALSRYNPNRAVPVFYSPSARAAGITNNPPLGLHPIHIIVKNGNVTLEGVVDSDGDRNLAGILANQAFGAFSVTNNLTVRS